MTTVTRLNQLQILEDLLQRHLQQGGLEVPIQFKCTRKETTLLVTGEHAAAANLNAKQTLMAIQQAIREIKPESVAQVGLSLKIKEQTQPYTFHSFPMEPKPKVKPKLVAITKEAENTQNPEENVTQAAAIPPVNPPEVEEIPNSEAAQDLQEPLIEHPFDLSSLMENLEENPFDVNDLEPEPEAAPITATPAKKSPPKSGQGQLIILTIATAASLLLLGGIYVFSRPCVLGKCQALETAQKLNQLSTQSLQNAKGSTNPQESKNQLTKAIELIETIPFWSIHYPKAQGLLKGYRQASQNLDHLLAAFQTATLAAQKSQNPPHSSKEWIAIQSHWRAALTQLEEIPSDSPVYPLAQKKLQEYRANFVIVKERIAAEEQGEKKLIEAMKTAQIAQAQEGVARFLESWQQVANKWQTTVNQLSAIPPGTMAFQQSRTYLERYQRQLNNAQERKTLEEIGADNYNQAVNAALQAQTFEQRNNWLKAVEYWRQALNFAKQVPFKSSYYVQTQPLIASHSESLRTAEVKQKIEAQLDKARQDLRKTCGGNPPVCTYDVTSDLITIRIAPAYLQKIQQMAGTDKPDPKSREAVEKHVKTLQAALATISNNAKVPLEVYDPNGQKIAAHLPK